MTVKPTERPALASWQVEFVSALAVRASL